MNVPDKAMDAAFRAATGDAELHLDDRMYWEQVARDMLAAAAPFIAAQALRDAALDFAGADLGSDLPAHWLNDRADEMDPL